MAPPRIADRTGIIASFVAVAILAACNRGGGVTQTSGAPIPFGKSDSMYVAQARVDSARRPYSAADVQFMSAMIAHHSQAIVISRWAPTHGATTPIRTLAERIINGQQDEIATMQQWLRDRLQPVPNGNDGSIAMSMNGVEHSMAMPGMLGDAELKGLDAARGPEFDKLFLTLMIRHHRGAVAMVKSLFGSYGAAQDETVFRLASDVNVDQSTEIARMEKMLASLPPQTP